MSLQPENNQMTHKKHKITNKLILVKKKLAPYGTAVDSAEV